MVLLVSTNHEHCDHTILFNSSEDSNLHGHCCGDSNFGTGLYCSACYKCVETCLALVVCTRARAMWNSYCPRKLLLCSLTLSLICALFGRAIYENTQGVPGGICHMSGEHSVTKHTFM